MARINFEDKLFRDARFMDLILTMGSREAAAGAVVLAWFVAQEFWLNGKHGIPIPEWSKRRLKNELIDCGLAEARGDFIYMCGSEEQFAWLIQKQEAGRKGGISSGVVRNNPDAKSLENFPSETKRREAVASGAKPLTLTLTTTNQKSKNTPFGRQEALPLPNDLQIESGIEAGNPLAGGRLSPAVRSQDLPHAAAPSQLFIAAWVTAYQSRYKARPVIDGKTAGGVKRLLASVPLERACQLAQVYLQMDDPWFKTKCHDFETFAQNLNKVSVALETGNADPSKPRRRGIAEILADKEKKNAPTRI